MSWYAVYTRCNHERSVNKILLDKGINTYLPQILVPSRRRNKKLMIRRPLYLNYLFVDLYDIRSDWMKVFRTPGVVRICGSNGPESVPSEAIESIKIFLNSDRDKMPLPFLCYGSKVQVISGPLCGACGILIEREPKKRRLVVSIELMGQSVSASLFDDEVISF